MPEDHYFLVESKLGSFYSAIKVFSDHHMIFVGSVQPCVRVRYEVETNHFIMLVASYDQHCNLNGNMQNGKEIINMVKCAFTLLRKMYPKAKKHIVFSDESSIPCKLRTNINLATFYLGIHGKTWYEEKF
jgi:hypothetical protein